MNSFLCLRFMDGDSAVARLTISSDSFREYGVNHSDVPVYVDLELTENVFFISKEDEIDGSTPIQVFCGYCGDLSHVLLLEETDYEFELERMVSEVTVDDELHYLRSNGDTISCQRSRFFHDDVSLYRFRSRSYVGKAFFDVSVGGREIRIPFEIRSRKMSYRRDYPQMIADISEFYTSVLLQSDSPVYSDYGLSGKASVSLYEDFMVLDHMFSNLDLPGIYEMISRDRHSELTGEYHKVPAGCAGFLSPTSVEMAVASGGIVPTADGVFADEVYESVSVDSEDTPENRLVKDLFLRIRSVIDALDSKIMSNGLSGTHMSDRVGYIRGEVDRILADSWLRDVGNLTMVPYNSSVLQKRRGYRDIFIMYMMLGMGTALYDPGMSDLLKGHNRRVYQVYEYWCYVRLYRCLYDMSVNHPPYPVDLSSSSGNMEVSPRRARIRFRIQVIGRECDVDLYYNHEFGTVGDGIRSYSIPLRPDFTLRITHGNEAHIINFDAKYKVKFTNSGPVNDDDITSEYWEFDIYKMHTYRDALLRSFGSYVMYPGDKGELYEKNGENSIIPSVGAVSMIPGRECEGSLRNLIRGILERICLSDGELNLDSD